MDVLVIEDCMDSYELIKSSLVPFDLEHVTTIGEASQVLQKKIPKLMIIDVELPDGDGVDFCTHLMGDSKFKNIPKILLTSRSEVAEIVLGLYSGADDYITKPFSLQELKARCKLRMKGAVNEKLYVFGPFQFDLEMQKCLAVDKSKRVQEFQLTPTEFKILYTLVSNEGTSFTRTELVRKSWKVDGVNIVVRGIDTHISHLRKKLGVFSKGILSVYGKGYIYREEDLKKSLEWEKNQ